MAKFKGPGVVLVLSSYCAHRVQRNLGPPVLGLELPLSGGLMALLLWLADRDLGRDPPPHWPPQGH